MEDTILNGSFAVLKKYQNDYLLVQNKQNVK
jgi:hypothetical protein